MENRTVEISVAVELLRSALGIPDSVGILAAKVDHETCALRMIISHAVFPEVAEGCVPPRATVDLNSCSYPDEPAWARSRHVVGAINVDGANLLLIDAMIARKG